MTLPQGRTVSACSGRCGSCTFWRLGFRQSQWEGRPCCERPRGVQVLLRGPPPNWGCCCPVKSQEGLLGPVFAEEVHAGARSSCVVAYRRWGGHGQHVARWQGDAITVTRTASWSASDAAIAREISVPETITLLTCRTKDVGEGDRGHQGADEARHDGDDQPDAGPVKIGDDRRRGNGPQGDAGEARRPLLVEAQQGRAAKQPRRCRASAGCHRDWVTSTMASTVAARHLPPRARCQRRDGRHHAAHRRVSR